MNLARREGGRLDPRLIGAVVIGAILRLWNLGAYELWADELHSALLADSSIRELLDPAYMAPYMPIYFLIAKAWATLVGGGEFVLRLLPAISGLLLIPAAYVLLAREGEQRAAGTCALLIAVNPLMVYFSREHRMYSLYVLALAVVATMFFSTGPRPGGVRWLASCCLGLASFLVFPFALFFGAGLFVGIPFEKTPFVTRLTRAAPLLIGMSAGAVWMAIALARGDASDNAYYAQLNPRLLLSLAKNVIAGNFSRLHRDLLWTAYLLLPLGGLLAVRGLIVLRTRRPFLAAWSGFALIPLLAIGILQAGQGAIYNYKSFIPVTLPALLFLSAGIASLPRRFAPVVLILFMACNLWVDRAMLDRDHPYNWNTPRTTGYTEHKTILEGVADDADGVFAQNHLVALAALHYGTPGGLPFFYIEEDLLRSYPSFNRPSLAAILRRGGRPWRSFDRPPASLLVAIGMATVMDRYPPGYRLEPIAGLDAAARLIQDSRETGLPGRRPLTTY